MVSQKKSMASELLKGGSLTTWGELSKIVSSSWQKYHDTVPGIMV